MKSYQTNRALWCVMSVVVFIAMGLLLEFSEGKSLFNLFGAWIDTLFSSRQAPATVTPLIPPRLGLLLWMGTWLAPWCLVAVVAGWFFQSVVVIVRSRMRRDPKI